MVTRSREDTNEKGFVFYAAGKCLGLDSRPCKCLDACFHLSPPLGLLSPALYHPGAAQCCPLLEGLQKPFLLLCSGVLVTHREFDAFPTARAIASNHLRAFHHPEARHWLPPGPAFCLRVACFGPSYECSSNYAGFVCSCAWLLSLASVLDVVLLLLSPDI